MPKLWADSLDEHRALVRGRLVDAFLELLEDRPLDEVTVAAVAERADIARSAVYNHVDHLHDLALFHAERTMGAWADEVRAVGDAPAPERLATLVAVSLRTFAEDPIGGMELSGHMDAERRARLRGMLAPLREETAAICRDGVASGDFVDRDPMVLAGFVWAVVGGYRPLVGTGRVDVDETAAAATELLLRALVADADADADVDAGRA